MNDSIQQQPTTSQGHHIKTSINPWYSSIIVRNVPLFEEKDASSQISIVQSTCRLANDQSALHTLTSKYHFTDRDNILFYICEKEMGSNGLARQIRAVDRITPENVCNARKSGARVRSYKISRLSILGEKNKRLERECVYTRKDKYS